MPDGGGNGGDGSGSGDVEQLQAQLAAATAKAVAAEAKVKELGGKVGEAEVDLDGENVRKRESNHIHFVLA